ncbi:MAG: ABC transporter ATP-binding protein [Planctomycetota bacterium]
MPGVELRAVTKRYKRSVTGLDAVTLSLSRGSLTTVLGPSGCGKSTLLRLVAGLDRPDAGEIIINGRPMRGVRPSDRGVAMVFQDAALYPHLTARRNITEPLRVRGIEKREIESRLAGACDLLGLTDEIGRKPSELSGGQRQRVALARALVLQPSVLLLDEPLRGLDANERLRIRRELRAVHDRTGATTLCVTHDQSEAFGLGDRVVLVSAGRVHQVGAPAELLETPATRFAAGFVGSPPRSVIDGEVAGDPETGLRFFERKNGMEPPCAEGFVLPASSVTGLASVAGEPASIAVPPTGMIGPVGMDGPPGLYVTTVAVFGHGHDTTLHAVTKGGQDVTIALGRVRYRGMTGEDHPAVGERFRWSPTESGVRLYDASGRVLSSGGSSDVISTASSR